MWWDPSPIILKSKIYVPIYYASHRRHRIKSVEFAPPAKKTGSFKFINSYAGPPNQLNQHLIQTLFFRPCQLIRIYNRTIYLVGPKAMHYHNSTPYSPVHMPWVLALKLHPNRLSSHFPLENRGLSGQSYANGRAFQKLLPAVKRIADE